MPGKDGVTLREKLEQLEATTGSRPAALDPPGFPEAALDAFPLWADLNSGRTSNGMGAAPISWLDIDAWSRMRGIKPTLTELDLIRTIDRAFLAAQPTQEM
jgi:hypothetical protein